MEKKIPCFQERVDEDFAKSEIYSLDFYGFENKII